MDIDQKTLGGSADFFALTDIMERDRPDLVFFENVQDIAEKKDNDESNMDLLKEKWGRMGYQCVVAYTDTNEFGLPQHRKRVVIVAVNTRDPKPITFTDRPFAKVFDTLRALLLLCHRKPQCASKYLLGRCPCHRTAGQAPRKRRGHCR